MSNEPSNGEADIWRRQRDLSYEQRQLPVRAESITAAFVSGIGQTVIFWEKIGILWKKN